MELTVNGRSETHPDSINLEQLLERLDLAGKPCAVEVNKQLVRKPERVNHTLADGDTVEVVTFVGGG